MTRRPTLALLALVLLAGCASTSSTDGGVEPEPTSHEIVQEMIEAHGGMERWASAPTVSFQDDFIPAAAGEGQASRVTVEQGRRRVYIDFPGTRIRMAWDGEKAWSENWMMPFPPRFLALLNYYFLNLPWLAMDPGVNLGPPGTARLWDDTTDYVTIEMTFDASVGDSPDDRYVLYIHPTTRRLAACRYSVTYAGLQPEGAPPLPEHILVYDEVAGVNRLIVPTHYSIYELDRTPYARCEIRDWSFSRPFDESRMEMTANAVLDESLR
jgi:hypothetical protein